MTGLESYAAKERVRYEMREKGVAEKDGDEVPEAFPATRE